MLITSSTAHLTLQCENGLFSMGLKPRGSISVRLALSPARTHIRSFGSRQVWLSYHHGNCSLSSPGFVLDDIIFPHHFGSWHICGDLDLAETETRPDINQIQGARGSKKKNMLLVIGLNLLKATSLATFP